MWKMKPREFQISQGHAAINNKDKCKDSGSVLSEFKDYSIEHHWTVSFSMIHQMLAIWSLVPLPFLNPAWTSGSSWFMYYWNLAWRILSITLLVWDECNCGVVWAFFGIAFLWDCNENWYFPVLWPLLCFPNLLAYWVKHFHSIIFQDLK